MQTSIGKSRRPVHLCTRASSHNEVNVSQEWLQTRFNGLQPRDFTSSGSLAVYASSPLVAPTGFHHVWRSIGEHHQAGGWISSEECHLLHSSKVLLVVADLSDSRQMQDVNLIGRFISHFFGDQQGPHVALVHHSVRPLLHQEPMELPVVAAALQHGIHDIIIGAKVSFKLAWAVQNSLLQHDVTKEHLRQYCREEPMTFKWKENLECCVEDTFWDYLRQRLNIDIPPLDLTIEAGQAMTVDGMEIGACLGKGSRGTVVRELRRDGSSIGQVLKMVPKRHMSSLSGIKALGQQIEVMKLLRSESCRHPNITQLFDIYHSETHILFRLQDGGPRDLHKRLRHRDNRHSPLATLSASKALSMMKQISLAICHLHSGPGIVHLDIKPENIIVSENPEDVRITISDFDTAVLRPSLTCCGVVGTYPFIAPELYQQKSYNPYFADVWSMAVVFLEVACCIDVVGKALHLPALPTNGDRSERRAHEKKMSASIHHFFSQADSTSRLLKLHLHRRLQDLMGSLELLLPSMLQTTNGNRATSSQVVQTLYAVE